ncbi:MAG: NAD(P)/FAD-dependent oxidoreductase [Methanobacterium sp.]|nr:NAD(P)/FAD-dependent oxidoreductase [Methanobacterium sp.]
MKIMIIGGGPAGKTAAREASQIGEEVTLIEKNLLGGKCLNEGCMVVSGLNDVAKFFKDSQRFYELGISSNPVEIDYEKLAQGVKDTIAKIRSVHEAETREADIEILNGEATVQEGQVQVNDEEHQYDRLIIATGSKAFIPPIKGAEKAATYEDILDFKTIPDELIIVGSGVIAAEFAGIFSSLGSQVHILCRNQFLKMLDEDVKKYVERKLLENVEIQENVQVKLIKKEGLYTDNIFLKGDVLLATGMRPNSDIINEMVNLGDRGEVIVNQQMESNHKHIYAAGDVIGGIGTTPVARMEGIVAARNACGIYTLADYSFIANSISLYYDVAFINKETNDYKVDQEINEGSIPGFAGPGSFWRVLERNTGFTKVKVQSESGEIRDVSSISPSARTSLAYVSKMMRDNYKTHDFDDFTETHPSTDPIYKLMRYFSKFG